jgi:Transglycosylase SLT domain
VLLVVSSCHPAEEPPESPLAAVRTNAPAPQTSPMRQTPARPRHAATRFRPGRLPTGARALTRYLSATDHALERDVARWRTRGGSLRSAVGKRVLIEGFHQQQVYRYLATRTSLAGRMEAMVGRKVLQEMHANLGAARNLASLVSPLPGVPSYRFSHPASPHKLLGLYRAAQERFGVPWYVLAAVNFVESKFGRILGPSSAGAQGPMQFLPATFAAYGRGDINDPHDSIMAAARYLHADGAPERLRAALFAYNRADAYVDAVLRYARQMRSNRWSFWAYYGYQVYVLTKGGPVRLTGPGTKHPD